MTVLIIILTVTVVGLPLMLVGAVLFSRFSFEASGSWERGDWRAVFRGRWICSGGEVYGYARPGDTKVVFRIGKHQL